MKRYTRCSSIGQLSELTDLGHSFSFQGYLPDYLYFECPASKNDFLVDFISNQHAWAWVLWLLSQCWITFHIW